MTTWRIRAGAGLRPGTGALHFRTTNCPVWETRGETATVVTTCNNNGDVYAVLV